jgi:hypothetical protein
MIGVSSAASVVLLRKEVSTQNSIKMKATKLPATMMIAFL